MILRPLGLEVVELGEGGVGVGKRGVAGHVLVRRGNEEEPHDVGFRVAHAPQFLANQEGEVEEHAAAGTAAQTGDDVRPGTVGSQPEFSRVFCFQERVVG